MKISSRTYFAGSTLLTIAMLVYVSQAKVHFYKAAVHLAVSKSCLLVLGNMGFASSLVIASLVIKIFLGSLREQELEHLNDRVGSTFMETLLAMTIFRDDFDAKFFIMFGVLLYFKIFHWICQDRVDYIEHSPAMSRMTYIKIFSLLVLLTLNNMGFVYYAAVDTSIKGPSSVLLFGFEFAVLTVTSITTIVKFFFNMEDIRREGRWERKGEYLLYVEFVADVFKLSVYLLFFSVILTYYAMPLHIMRQMYVTFSSFRRRVIELIQYRRATHDMHTRFQDATTEEISRTDGVCIVCREEMVVGNAKKLPCNHIIHFQCLRSWLERQQTCPTCRRTVLVEDMPPEQRPGNENNNNNNDFGNRFNAPGFFFARGPNNGQLPAFLQRGPNNGGGFQIPGFLNGNGFIPPPHADNDQEGLPRDPADANYSALEHVESIQRRLAAMQQELSSLANYLRSNPPAAPVAGTAPSSSSSSSSSSATTTRPDRQEVQETEETDEPSEEELLEQAMRESAAEFEQQQQELQQRKNQTPTFTAPPTSASTSSDSASASSSSQSIETDEDREAIRKRRLLRFSQPGNEL